MPDGSVCNDPVVVLEKWRSDYCDLLNPADTTANHVNSNVDANENFDDNSIFNDMISIDEILKCILSSKSNKSW